MWPIVELNIVEELRKTVARQSEEVRIVERARVVLARLEGVSIIEVSKSMCCSVTFVKKWWSRFCATPTLNSLCDRPRTGRPHVIPAVAKTQVIALACAEPTPELAPCRNRWTLGSLALAAFTLTDYRFSVSEIHRILSNKQIRPHKTQMWLHSPDPEFREKSQAICELYTNPPQDTHIICIDEKTGMQALERIYAGKPARPGMLPRREFEYRRNGTQSLIASFDVQTGGVWAHCGSTRTTDDLLEFMEDLATNVYDSGKVIVIWDNLNTHKGERWLEFNRRHGHRFQFMYTPIHASWLNQIEIWFGILEARVLRHGSFSSEDNLQKAVLDFIDHWIETEAHPFRWVFRGKFEAEPNSETRSASSAPETNLQPAEKRVA